MYVHHFPESFEGNLRESKHKVIFHNVLANTLNDVHQYTNPLISLLGTVKSHETPNLANEVFGPIYYKVQVREIVSQTAFAFEEVKCSSVAVVRDVECLDSG